MPEAQPNPAEIWNAAVEEGVRRAGRGIPALIATGFVGGADVMLGVGAMTSLSGGLSHSMTHQAASALGAFAFGIGFVFITIGRSELFTENFLIPVAAALSDGADFLKLARLYATTLLANLVGLVTLSAVFVTK